MAKDKKRNAAQKRQKRALKQARRRHENRGKVRPLQGPPRPNFDLDAVFPEHEYVFWLAHGANYLASDYHEGNWTPVFPELYTGRLYQPEELVRMVLAHYESQGDPQGKQKRVLAWLLTDKHLIWAFKAGMAAKILGAHPTEVPADVLREPRNGVLWEGFSNIFDSIQGEIDAENNPTDDNDGGTELPTDGGTG